MSHSERTALLDFTRCRSLITTKRPGLRRAKEDRPPADLWPCVSLCHYAHGNVTGLIQRCTRGIAQRDLEDLVAFDIGVLIDEHRQSLARLNGRHVDVCGRVLEITFLRGSTIVGYIIN